MLCRRSSFEMEQKSPSSSFELLHERLRRWIWNQNWDALRDIQEAAIEAILRSSDDVVISAATAAGKTEAAFLPICSRILIEREADSPDNSNAPPSAGIQALYVGPLKALINDQWLRLDLLCESMAIDVHRWHGDVSHSAKQRLMREPRGILLITPESLEALFVIHGARLRTVFAGLADIVVDELHAFPGTERGMQLQSLLHRLEVLLGRRVRRIGLSATLGDMGIAAHYLRPSEVFPKLARPGQALVEEGPSPNVRAIVSEAGGEDLLLQIRGYENRQPSMTAESGDAEEEDDAPLRAIATHLFKVLRGSNNLIFANSRGNVELLSDMLRRLCEENRIPREFWPHHGSLSKELRTDVEEMLKSGSLPISVVCTSTLEMGIDIGAVKSIAQVGVPPSVASLRQRLGRSGRRGDPPELRLYIIEEEITTKTAPHEAIRANLVESNAMLELLLEKWIEPPADETIHPSTLVQQVLSLIAQNGGVTAKDAWRTLCSTGPFAQFTPELFADLLRALGSHDLVVQSSDGTLLHGKKGEAIVGHFSFYAAFVSPEEFEIVYGSTRLGSLPIVEPLTESSLVIFAGRRWRVLSVDQDKKRIDVVPAPGGRVPRFSGQGQGLVHDEVRRRMLSIYESDAVPAFLDKSARRLLAEGRDNFRRLELSRVRIVRTGDSSLLFPWAGDRAMNRMCAQLQLRGLDVSKDGVALVVHGIKPERLEREIGELSGQEPADRTQLAAGVLNKVQQKYDCYLPKDLLDLGYASQNF
jgi:ATP-dependent Lhr-like helicase